MPKKKKKIVPHESWTRFGILNHLGSFWSENTFASAGEAQEYIDACMRRSKLDLHRHTVVPVKVTIEALEK